MEKFWRWMVVTENAMKECNTIDLYTGKLYSRKLHVPSIFITGIKTKAAEEIARWLGTLAAFTEDEDPRSVLSTHTLAHYHS